MITAGITSSRAVAGALAAAAAIVLASCGSPSTQYYHVALSPLGSAQGQNCGTVSTTETYSDVGESADWAIYPGESNQYLLEGVVGGSLLTGSLSGSKYSFTGTFTEVETTTNSMSGNSVQVTMTETIAISLTTSGSGLTGTMTVTNGCQSSDGMTCEPFNSTSTSDANYSCSQQTSVSGTNLGSVKPETFQDSEVSGSL